MIRPTSTAIIPARVIAVAGLSAATSGRIAAKMSGDTDESGPSTRTREGPIRAYPTRQAIVVYSPVTGGKPGELGVGHPLGHQDGRQHQPGHQVRP